MFYFTVWETLSLTLILLLFGTLFGAAYSSFKIILAFPVRVVFLPLYSFKKYFNIQNTKQKQEQNLVYKILNHILDFVFMILLTVSLMVISYIFSDGAVRAYSILFFAIGYIFSFKFLSRPFSFFSIKSTGLIYAVLANLTFLILYPMFFGAELIKKIIMPIINRVKLSIRKQKNNKIIKSKLKKAEAFLIK